MVNILASCTFYFVDLNQVDEDLVREIKKDYELVEKDDCLNLSGAAIEAYQEKFGENCFKGGIKYNSAWFNGVELVKLMEKYLENRYHFLVFGSGINGSVGYRFCENAADTVDSDSGAVVLMLEKEIGNKKAIICNRTSRDIPMGSKVYIIGLTDKEFEKLSAEETTYEDVEKFVKKTCEG